MMSTTRITNTIIATNIGVFCVWQYSETDFRTRKFLMRNFTMSTDGVMRQGRIHTTVTSMFSHKDFFHLASNMITFYFFAPPAAYMLGSRGFLQLYLGGGMFSSLSYVLWPYFIPSTWPARYRTSTYNPALGASGAVNAIVIYSILLNPRQIIYVNLLLPMPAALFGALYILQDAYYLYKGGSNVGNAAHLGGAFFGTAFFVLRRFR